VDIAACLYGLGLQQYEQALCQNAIDAAVLPELTADDPKVLCVRLVGHGRKLLAAMAALPSDIVPVTDTPLAASTVERRQPVLRHGHSETAEEQYRKAVSMAEEQEAKLWELRAAANLARLRRDQGRRVEVRNFFAPVYGWFTEGFDTQDLKDEKALLDELGGW
jgi:hypothetical protein